MRSSIKLLLFSLSLTLLALASPAWAQEKTPDAVKLSVSFTNSEYSNLFSTEYAQGLSAELDAKIARYDRFRIGGVFQWNRANISDSQPVDTYSAGPQVSVDFFKGHISPFGRALFGVTTSYQQDRAFSRIYEFGFDVNLGHLVLRPFGLGYQKIEGVPGAAQRYSAGVGVRF